LDLVNAALLDGKYEEESDHRHIIHYVRGFAG
jgi:hypothetical protein